MGMDSCVVRGRGTLHSSKGAGLLNTAQRQLIYFGVNGEQQVTEPPSCLRAHQKLPAPQQRSGLQDAQEEWVPAGESRGGGCREAWHLGHQF